MTVLILVGADSVSSGMAGNTVDSFLLSVVRVASETTQGAAVVAGENTVDNCGKLSFGRSVSSSGSILTGVDRGRI